MFRATDRQLPLMGSQAGLSASAQQRLKNSWAHGFREKVMPELLGAEESFSILYAQGGRPNWSVARLLGVCLLQQLQDMSDQQALDALSFDVRWQHALDVPTEDAYVSRRSLVEFRRRLVEHDPDGSLLRGVFDRLCAAGVSELGLSTSEQRLDSTLVASDIRAHGRLSLARETLRLFLRSLNDAQCAQLSGALQAWHAGASADGWDDEGKPADRKARLKEIGALVQLALETFANDEAVSCAEPYDLLRRLASEHAEALGLATSDDSDGSQNAPPSGPSSQASDQRRQQRNKRKTNRRKPHKARYWSPHDPDASFGHKGLGYHVHVAETCRNAATELLTDFAVVTAAQSDVGQSAPSLERLQQRGIAPDVMYADGGYPTPDDLVKARQQGTELYAPVNRGRLPADSFSRAHFAIDSASRQAMSCPAGHSATRHGQRESSDSIERRRALFAFFSADTCDPCPQRPRCPVRQPNNARSREYRLELSEQLLARDARWAEQHTEPWRERYRIRSGVEATMSELKRSHGLQRLRVRRKPRVLIQVAFKATACNIKRWLRACAAVWRVLPALQHAPIACNWAHAPNFPPLLRAA